VATKNKSAADEILYVQTCLSDHRRDVAGMSAEQRGVYESMRVACLQQGGALPLELTTIYRLAEAHTAKERKAVQEVLEQKFMQEVDGYHNAFCDAELMRIRTLRLVRKGAAITRWKDRQEGSDGDANAYPNALHMDMQTGMQTGMQTACKDDANRKPVTVNRKPIKEDVVEDSNTLPFSSKEAVVVPAPLKNKPDKVGADKGEPISSTYTLPQPQAERVSPRPLTPAEKSRKEYGDAEIARHRAEQAARGAA
jgi:uncharacterized protein YdaU (DUF1376 family)